MQANKKECSPQSKEYIDDLLDDIQSTISIINDLKMNLHSIVVDSSNKNLKEKLQTIDHLITSDQFMVMIGEETLRSLQAEKELIKEIINQTETNFIISDELKKELNCLFNKVDVQLKKIDIIVKKANSCC